MRKLLAWLVLACGVPLAACQQDRASQPDRAALPGDTADNRPFSLIGEEETVHFTGTEPFWGGEAKGGSLTYSTPENTAAAVIAVSRFAGRGGITFSGELDGAKFDLLVTEGQCSDGMSERSYPFTATLSLGGEVRRGCAWSDSRPATGGEDG